MKEKGTCVTAGKCVGSTYRWAMEKTAKFRSFFNNAAKSMAEEARTIKARFGNLFKKVKTGGQLAHWEMKQKDNFAKLGEEVFKIKKDKKTDALEGENIQEIMSNIEKDQDKINTIKEEDYAQKKRMEEMMVLKRATAQLESPEVRLRRVAIRVLERLGKKEAIPYLVNLLEDPDMDIRNLAKDVIRKLSDLN